MPTDISLETATHWVIAVLPYAFIALLVVFLVLGGVLDFHWRRYGTGLIQTFKFRIAYVVCGVIFLGVMSVALSSF